MIHVNGYGQLIFGRFDGVPAVVSKEEARLLFEEELVVTDIFSSLAFSEGVTFWRVLRVFPILLSLWILWDFGDKCITNISTAMNIIEIIWWKVQSQFTKIGSGWVEDWEAQLGLDLISQRLWGQQVGITHFKQAHTHLQCGQNCQVTGIVRNLKCLLIYNT